MNLQMNRIEAACATLKLQAIGQEWPRLAEVANSRELSLADYLESLLNAELEVRAERTRATLTKFATGAPRKQLKELTVYRTPLLKFIILNSDEGA